MIARLAAGLARSPHPEHRWRRIAVPIAAALFLLLVMAGLSIVLLIQRQQERDVNRTGLVAEIGSPTDLLMLPRADEWGGEQFAVVWIEPAGDTAPILPPGMATLPEPGQAALSPALDRLAARTPELASRYPDPLVLGSEGIRNGGELFAYVRVPADRSLAENWRTVRVSAFGAPAEGEQALPPGFPSPVRLILVVEGVLVFLVVPGLLLLVVGISVASSVRDRRFAGLRWLGAAPRTLLVLTILETLFLALPGLVLTTLWWGVIAPRLEQVPFADHGTVRGDLGLPWWLVGVALITGVATTAAVAALTLTIRGRHREKRPRPDDGRATVTPLRVAPLGFAIMSWVMWKVVGGTFGATMFYAGVIMAVAAVPLLLPGLLRPAGTALSRIGSVPALLAGRSLAWDPIRTARPFANFGALVVLALATGGYFALILSVPAASTPGDGASAILVGWIDPRPDDTKRLADALGTGLVAPIQEDGNALSIGVTCAELSPYVDGAACDPQSPYGLSEDSIQEVSWVTGQPGIQIGLIPASDIAASGQAIVFDDVPVADLHGRVRAAVMPLFAAPSVNSALTDVQRPSPLAGWLAGGIAVALITLAVACVVAIIDRLLATRRDRRHLLNLGMLPRQLAVLEAWRFAAPYTIVFTVAAAVGLAIAAQFVIASGAEVLWTPLVYTLAAAAVAGIVGTAGMAAFSYRSSLLDESRGT